MQDNGDRANGLLLTARLGCTETPAWIFSSQDLPERIRVSRHVLRSHVGSAKPLKSILLVRIVRGDAREHRVVKHAGPCRLEGGGFEWGSQSSIWIRQGARVVGFIRSACRAREWTNRDKDVPAVLRRIDHRIYSSSFPET